MCLHFYIFGKEKWKTKDLAWNVNKRSLISICSYYVPEKNSDILSSFQKFKSFPPFRRKYYQPIKYDFVLQSDLKTRPCTVFYQHSHLVQSSY